MDISSAGDREEICYFTVIAVFTCAIEYVYKYVLPSKTLDGSVGNLEARSPTTTESLTPNQ